ncbi:J domain-containing protein [Sphingomonas sp. JC676]|uniref:J domain-containing protein n=1 Tax=Sphingomonas sp. JC676 TaxID=2768065 RepID=UPI00292A5CD5|nr:J domain-containing protein [Sphingomonas sp. JC676]
MASSQPKKDRPNARFHGRVEAEGRKCAEPGCAEAGEFRAPPLEGTGFTGDGPPQFRWLCLDHVRAFNSGYNFFAGMSPDEIHDAQRPLAGWERETRAFNTTGGADRPPRWADFSDPLDAIGARFRDRMKQEAGRQDGKPLSGKDRDALKTLELEVDADRMALRKRYSELVRRYHPDRNGGDRSHEARLQRVIEAYQQLRSSPAFA